MSKHTFALYLQDSFSSSSIMLRDNAQLHRLQRVIRIEVGDTCIFFNDVQWVVATIIDIQKKVIVATIKAKYAITSTYKRRVSVMLPLLKSDDLHTAIYNLTEMGVYEIQLLTTEKTQGRWNAKIAEKLQKISIAAAEQSKNFSRPLIHKPITLQTALQNSGTKVLLCEYGDPAHLVQETYRQDDHILIFLGPEGGLTEQEFEACQDALVHRCKLTQTVLRAVQAATLGSALFLI